MHYIQIINEEYFYSTIKFFKTKPGLFCFMLNAWKVPDDKEILYHIVLWEVLENWAIKNLSAIYENFKIYLYLNLCLNFTHIYRLVKNILNGYFSIHVYSEMGHTCLNLIGHVFILIEAHEPLKYNW